MLTNKRPIIAFWAAAKRRDETMRAKYLEAGAPYGDSDEGFTRWRQGIKLQREADTKALES